MTKRHLMSFSFLTICHKALRDKPNIFVVLFGTVIGLIFALTKYLVKYLFRKFILLFTLYLDLKPERGDSSKVT